ncbi:HAMP domain-containing histidine kinase [Vallitalea pronyensis]|uniref:histidine kinase n=1 Tax=Vallitalea pronyensis TaxID=1348613 RepID=A0A8J8MHF3_9FIRM|nr:HAMP domain-containing sensor histidine kinase [Vallitalea pronyensis]QUI21669.1 HAMP domain-containing histidine kinase [Vallitalea pronyensis]
MKKRLLAISIISIIFSFGLDVFQHNMSERLVHHMEAGNFINTKDLDMSKVTMLHWFSKEVEVYSEDQKSVDFVIFNPYRLFNVYKNKEHIIQNESKNYPKYQGGKYMLFSIDEMDYSDNRVSIYTEVDRNSYDTWNLESMRYEEVYFAGSHRMLNNFIVCKESIHIIAVASLIIAVVVMLLTHQKELMGILLAASTATVLFDFKIGLILVLHSLYVYSETLIKRKHRKFIFIPLLLSFGMPLDYYVWYAFVLMLMCTVKYYKKSNIKCLLSLLGLSAIVGLLNMDLEFSLFRLFYTELFILFLSALLLIIGIMKGRVYFSKEKMIRIDLLRGVSHDLRVPLSTIRLNMDILAKDDFTSEINKDRVIHTMNSALQDLGNMTTGLTAYISKDHYVHRDLRTSFQDCLAHSLNYFTNNEKMIDIKTKICEEEIFLPIEKVWLNRLIYNLVDNAYKYTGNYGVITVSLWKEKKRVYFSVEDNGIGITDEQMLKIMKPFYKVDQSRGTSGLGLGLSIIQSIVNQLDGDIHIQSVEGEGTKVIIKI